MAGRAISRREEASLPLEWRAEIDRMCNAFEQQLRAGERPLIEGFLEPLPAAIQPAALREFLGVELEILRGSGIEIDPKRYRERFAQHRSIVDEELNQTVRDPEVASGDRPTSASIPQDLQALVPLVEECLTKSPVRDEPPPCFGRYIVRSILGEGGFGRVYLAHDPELDRLVAIKVPRPRFFATGHSIDHFLQEARTAARCDHPGLVRVFDVQREGKQAYIVQEYIDGPNLGVLLRDKRFSPVETVELLMEIAGAVRYLHECNLVHRDLKPSNILLDPHGRPHVADFGLVLHESQQWQRAGEIGGTWHYMAPEQVRGETHLLDGRADIWSLGVIMYELLAGKRPFPGTTPTELGEQIRTLEPRPPRMLDPTLPRELERICLKCLHKRRSDRHATAADLIEDLRCWLAGESLGEGQAPALARASTIDSAPRVIPKGLRSFDQEDAEFYLSLLPGPRHRDGLPESIRFWKKRIDTIDADEAFRVGLLYGPSGCGKSSLVKAGLLPCLAEHVVPVYIEATAEDTEVRLLKGIAKRLGQPSGDRSLPELLQHLRVEGIGKGRKLLIVIDQFEQWLHAHGNDEWSNQLVEALPQCDGRQLQCVAMVRDDFWMAATRFMRALEMPLVEGHNANAVDLFTLRHGEDVLARFGRALGPLPPDPQPLGDAQHEFLHLAVGALAENDKVVCVRLALFSEMMKDKPWTPESLEQVGGARGVGVTFLEETFRARSARPHHRLHEAAARQVLDALLPAAGTDLKGHMRSSEQLQSISGYASRDEDFAELIRVLDSELRLITPTEPDAVYMASDKSSSTQSAGLRYYQLTHDYLVPSLREWLTRKQRETRRGRAVLRLAECADLWNARPESRHLPTLGEYLSILFLVPRRLRRRGPAGTMMDRAGRFFGLRAAAVLAGLLVPVLVVQWHVSASRRENLYGRVRTAVATVASNQGSAVPLAIGHLTDYPERLVRDELQRQFDSAGADIAQRLSLAYARAHFGQLDLPLLLSAVAAAPGAECDNLARALRADRQRALEALAQAAADVSSQVKPDWSLKARYAVLALHLGDVALAAEMLHDAPDPVQRTTFIKVFPTWSGDVTLLALLLAETGDAQLRHGMALALGRMDAVPARSKERWIAILQRWFASHKDSGTHSACEWALRQWGVGPTAPTTSRAAGNDWEITPTNMTMIRVPSGSFPRIVAPDKPAETVEIAQAYWMASAEVTIGLVERFLDDTQYPGEKPTPAPMLRSLIAPEANHPAVNFSWTEAVMFCNWLSWKEGRAACYQRSGEGSEWILVEGANGYRLPTEDEWEHACRAGSTTSFCCGESEWDLGDYAVLAHNASHTAPVGGKLCNAWGLFDMHGNAAEWCQDLGSAKSPSATSKSHGVRGGSWMSNAVRCSSATHQEILALGRTLEIGFRVVRDDSSSPAAQRDKQVH